ncbi:MULTISPECIES: hypothetical protein [unclassified Bradyrhizobium]|uniref:hypothetical protein n=1 Tax=unclassified Bradyrhizobium TaxID=2631580 RepID=UPI001CD34B6B|nr:MULTISPECIES: hypothetical protein [unclassified Bradyrhizobium]MCA1374947.1 hypothetical protein [Bradyrhizobium sp. IC4060]MCA1484856.1 hypothetical protein [Bradyrhizobium sp. IC4061]MCA1538465.1 hypothetical protein [Bradyrhizobium sp. NBAIM32]
MYFLTACLIVVVLSAVVAYRRAGSLPRNLQGRLDRQQRRAAMWPLFCAGICALGLLGLHQVLDRQEIGPIETDYLLVLIMLITSFFGGWFLGVIGWMD